MEKKLDQRFRIDLGLNFDKGVIFFFDLQVSKPTKLPEAKSKNSRFFEKASAFFSRNKKYVSRMKRPLPSIIVQTEQTGTEAIRALPERALPGQRVRKNFYVSQSSTYYYDHFFPLAFRAFTALSKKFASLFVASPTPQQVGQDSRAEGGNDDDDRAGISTTLDGAPTSTNPIITYPTPNLNLSPFLVHRLFAY